MMTRLIVARRGHRQQLQRWALQPMALWDPLGAQAPYGARHASGWCFQRGHDVGGRLTIQYHIRTQPLPLYQRH